MTLAYLLGAIPVGLLVVQIISGEDIRRKGSGRTGGTNALRSAGLLAGVLTGLGDLAKGVGAVNVARLIRPSDPFLEALCAIAVVAGHNWSVYIRFRGGAGTGPNIGAAVALWPVSLAILAPTLVGTLILTGYASVASTVTALLIVVIFTWRAITASQPAAYIGYALVTALLVGIALIPNYRRLLAGTERVVDSRAKLVSGQRAEGESV